MSMFLMPHELMPDVNKMQADLDRMSRDFSAFLPKGWQGASNLMMHPIAASAAMTALGAGAASHAFGLWMGSVAATMETAQRMTALAFEGADRGGDASPVFVAPKSVAARAKAAADTFATEVETAAREVAAASLDIARDFAAEAEDALETATSTLAPGADEKPAAIGLASEPDASPSGPVKPAGMERPESVDDLKAISGVGPKLEQVLNGLGIWTYGQIASFGDGEVAWLDEHLGFRGRIGRDDWIGQARALAGEPN